MIFFIGDNLLDIVPSEKNAFFGALFPVNEFFTSVS
jgi:hypothetical protein